MKNFGDYSKAIVVLSFCRPEELKCLAESIRDNLTLYGHDHEEWPLLVVDTSPNEYEEQNLKALHNAGNGAATFYFGQKEFDEFASHEGGDFHTMFSGHGAADARNLAIMLCADKTLITLDDDMGLTESVLNEETKMDYPSLLSSGNFLHLREFQGASYKRQFDLVSATTSELGKRVREVPCSESLRGIAVGNRDKTIDQLMLGDWDGNGNGTYSFCHIEPSEIDPEAVVRYQGLAAVTGKADCHATASIQGLAMIANGDIRDYGNLFVSYAVHNRQPRVSVASSWRESTLAAFGILNNSPIPCYPLSRGEDVSYRQHISPENPVAISSVAVDHNRSPTGRPRLSLIYFNELMGAKICKKFGEIVSGDGMLNISDIEPLEKNQKRDVLKSMKKTCAILNMIRNNGDEQLAKYANRLILDIATAFSYEKNDNFWDENNFKESVYSTTEEYFNKAVKDTKMIMNRWDIMIEHARKDGIPVRIIGK